MISKEEYPVWLAEAAELLGRGTDLEDFIQFMRSKGFSPIDCIKGVMELTGSGLAEATKKVHFSAARRELQ